MQSLSVALHYTATHAHTDAARECLGVPMEFRVEGGAFHERLEPGEETVNSES